MGTLKPSGFTIIETMLFLAISGALVTVVLVGTGASINEQRYRDSVTSLQAVLQDQYSEVSNVRNVEAATPLTCGTQTVSRGQNDCVLLGRYIVTTDNKTLRMSSVVGYVSPGVPLIGSDLAVLRQYQLRLLAQTTETYTIEWGSELLQPVNNQPALFSVLIIRSPQSGAIRTFIDNNSIVADSAIGGLVTDANLTQNLKTCVDAGGVVGSRRTAISVLAGSATPGGIEVLGQEAGGC